VALPRDSYLQQYFADVEQYLRVGPPVMFVVQGLNLSRAVPDVARVCSVAGCDRDSLLNRVSGMLSALPAHLRPRGSFVGPGPEFYCQQFHG
jgi:hypothetical protein